MDDPQEVEPPSSGSLDDDGDAGLSLDEPSDGGGGGDSGGGGGDGDGDGDGGADDESPSHRRPIKADEHRNAATREHMEEVRCVERGWAGPRERCVLTNASVASLKRSAPGRPPR